MATNLLGVSGSKQTETNSLKALPNTTFDEDGGVYVWHIYFVLVCFLASRIIAYPKAATTTITAKK